MDCDVIIVGGGPAGLAFARSLDDSGLGVVLVERQPVAALAEPRFDGREIALTHASVRTLRALGAWDRIAEAGVSPLREARVLNGASPFALTFDSGNDAAEALGWLAPNHRIREALWHAVQGQAGLRVVGGTGVEHVRTGRRQAEVVLSSGEVLRGRLLVAADSRLSEVRAKLGIAAEINRLGRSMMVCRVAHEKPHGGVATEWFDHHQTIAMLPLAEGMSGAVLTLPAEAIDRLAARDDAALGEELTRRTARRWGKLHVESSRHVYPLVTTWSRHFAAPRAALIGDAAVGMHPVTAHGFNLGLSGQHLLAGLVREAVRRGRDIGGGGVLRAYEAGHRAASRPLYAGTNLLVRLYTDEAPAARIARQAGLWIGRLPIVQSSMRSLLMAK